MARDGSTHVRVSEDFFNKFIENPRKRILKRTGISPSQLQITRMIAKSGIKVPKLKLGDVMNAKRKKR